MWSRNLNKPGLEATASATTGSSGFWGLVSSEGAPAFFAPIHEEIELIWFVNPENMVVSRTYKQYIKWLLSPKLPLINKDQTVTYWKQMALWL